MPNPPSPLLLSFTDDQLFASLGKTLIDDDFGLGPADALKVGKEWWNGKSRLLFDTVRSSPTFIAFMADPDKWEDTQLLAAVADLVAPIVGIPPAASVSVLLLRRVFRKGLSDK
jgi:hypothetical protein